MASSSELYIKARQMMDEGNLEGAVELFEQSISDYPHFKSLELLGECFIRLNRFSEAIIPLAAATTLNKGVRAPSLLAEVFLNLKDYRQAREIAELALSRDSKNRTALEIKRASVELVGED
jgi:tetratricopeptide (TPR) repeat protein